MEHIIQFGVTIDDEKVVNQAIESAAKKIADDLEEVLFTKNSWNRITALRSDTEDLVIRAVEKHMDEIIKFAVHEVADTIKRSKKYKAVLQAMEDAAND